MCANSASDAVGKAAPGHRSRAGIRWRNFLRVDIADRSPPRSHAACCRMARLNIAKSRVRPATSSLVRIDQTCFGWSGGFAPISLPLFQGVRLGVVGAGFSSSGMVKLLSD
jgi:hypothetical protein